MFLFIGMPPGCSWCAEGYSTKGPFHKSCYPFPQKANNRSSPINSRANKHSKWGAQTATTGESPAHHFL